jgi:serine/threonine protein kinase
MKEARRLGRFTLIGSIASTPHSHVWEAVDDNGTRMAIKELKTRRIDKEPYRRFRDEVAFHRAGPHRGVLPVVDADVPEAPSAERPAWLAMPIATTVREALGDKSTLDEVAGAVRRYATTLAALAQKGVYHRDLKPDNLFRLDDGWLVGDFGLVTWPGKSTATEPGLKLGPANFVAPEMVQDARQADPGPADAWSLAKVLWVLATGQTYPPPGQLRVDVDATRLRSFTAHPRAAGLEGILEQATALDPTTRPSMQYMALELDAWSSPPRRHSDPPNVDELAKKIGAISAPAVADQEQRAELDRASGEISGRLRAAHKVLLPAMERLGKVIVRDEGLLFHGLGGKSKRRDTTSIWTESLSVVPRSPRHQVSLTVDVAWQRFTGHDIHLVAGIWLRKPDVNELPERFILETRDVRLGTERGLQAADELARTVIENFRAAAGRYADLLDEAEARIQADRQPIIECLGENYVFRTEPESGVVRITRRDDGSVDGHAVAWRGTPISAMRANGDRVHVRAGVLEGWIERNANQRWVLACRQDDELGAETEP